MKTKHEFFPKCKLSRTEMYAMRDEGYTFREIAETCGISRQRVFQLIGGTQKRRTTRPLTETECVYPNLRKWINDNNSNLTALTRQIYGETSSTQLSRVRRFLRGTMEGSLSKPLLDCVLAITGLTYEQLFSNN